MNDKHKYIWRNFFNQRAALSEDPTWVGGWSKSGFEKRFNLVKGFLVTLNYSGRFKLLDSGCDVGNYLVLAKSYGAIPVGLDISERALYHARKKNNLCVAGDVENLPFASGTFDVITSVGVLQSLTDPSKMLIESARVLKEGGRLLMETLYNGSMRLKLQKFLHPKKQSMYSYYSLPKLSKPLQPLGLQMRDWGYLYIFPMSLKSLASFLNSHKIFNRYLKPLAVCLYIIAQK